MALIDGVSTPAELRAKIVALLTKAIPVQGLSSSAPTFPTMTGGLTTASLKKKWDVTPAGQPGQTSCNSFAGWVAQQIGFKEGTTCCKGKLDLSGVENEVPGSWVWANTGEAIDAGLCPQPGDLFCESRPGQEFGHVGIVMAIEPGTTVWKWVAGGQGGRTMGVDMLRWGPWLPKHGRTFNVARTGVTGWVDVGAYFFPGAS